MKNINLSGNCKILDVQTIESENKTQIKLIFEVDDKTVTVDLELNKSI